MRPRFPVLLLVLALLLMAGVSGCGGTPIAQPPTAEPTLPPQAAPSALQLTVAGQPFDGAALRDLEVTKTVQTPKGEEATYTGIGLRALLDKVAMHEGSITLVASDGYASEVAVADVSDDCLLAYNDNGGLDAVMPGLGGGAWVKDVVEIGATEAAVEAEPEAETVITINGRAFTQGDLQALEQVSQDVDGKTYQGVRILDALEAAGVTAGQITMVASDGYLAAVDVAVLTPECLLAYADDGTVGAVFPGTDKGLWVKMLADISAEGGAPGGAAGAEAEVPADAILTVNDHPFALADLQSLPQVEQEIEGKAYQGVSLLAVLEAAGVTEGTILMTATDGYAAGVNIDALNPECLLAYESGGTVGAVLPGISRGSWVKMLGTITIDEGAPVASAEPLPTRVAPAAGNTRVVVDSLGNEVTIPAQVTSVASMRSGTTEIICALGQADKIIAVDEMVKAGESYGEFIASIHPELTDRAAPYRNRDINAEEMLRLNPDVVLHGGYGRISQAEALQKQVPDMPIVIAHFETIEEYMNDVRIVAQCVNAEDAAERLIATLQGTLDFVSERVQDVPEADKVRVFYGGHDIYKAYTGTTFEHAQIVMAGGLNVAADLEGWHPEVSAEQLLVWDPEVIIVLNGVDVDAILADPKVQGVSAIKNRRVYSLPEASWDFSSPRALFCIEWLAQILYPERFADIDIDAEADAFYRAVFGVDYTGPALGSRAPEAETRTITDMIGRRVEVPGRITRAMPLSSDITGVLMALGGGDRLAAVDSMTLGNANLLAAFPELADLPAPCAFFDANAESILAIDPDVVLTVSWQRDPDRLQEMMGIPVVCIDLNLYAPTIRFLSEIMGAEERADEIVGYYQERLAAIHEALQDVSRAERTRIYVAGNDMMSTYGAESTWHYEVLDAGGVNVAAALTGGGSQGVSMEQIMLWDPQVVVLDNACQDDVEDVLSDPRWAGVSAVQEGRVFRASPGYIGPWGRPHLESAMARVWLADRLYPDTLDLDIAAEAAAFYERVYGREFGDAELRAILGE